MGNLRSANPSFWDVSTTGLGTAQQPNPGAYNTPEQNGADYSIWGQIGNVFTGQNTNAENYTTALNQQKAEEREREFNAAQAELARNFNASEAAKEREFNAAEAEKAREWTAHSYERMVKDAKAAGINPLYLVGATGNTGTTAASAGAATGAAARASSSAPGMNNEKGGLNVLSFIGKIAITAASFAAKNAAAKTMATAAMKNEASLNNAKINYYNSAAYKNYHPVSYKKK